LYLPEHASSTRFPLPLRGHATQPLVDATAHGDEALEQPREQADRGHVRAGHPFVSQALSEIGSVYLAMGEQDKAIATSRMWSPDNVPPPIIKQAIEHFEEALAIEKAILDPKVGEIAETTRNIGSAQLRLG
jgi:hypothetical protein